MKSLVCLTHGSQLKSSKEMYILLSHVNPHKEMLRGNRHISSCIPSAGRLRQHDHWECGVILSYVVLDLQCGLQSETLRWGERQIERQ